jgi:CO dehydrogenase maturation factor
MKKGVVPGGMTKDVFMSMKLQQAIVEAKGFDLIVMGQPEGSGCYCAANSLLIAFLDKLIYNYPYIVMDNEAGMEHISRLTTRNVDVLLMVSDTSRRSILSAIRIDQLARELRIGVSKSYLIINQVKEALSPEIIQIVKDAGIALAGTIPEDSDIYAYDLNGQATVAIPAGNAAVQAAYGIFDAIIN